MNSDRTGPIYRALVLDTQNTPTCELGPEGHCITCSDEAVQVQVLSVDEAAGLACVTVQDTTEEVDISLVDSVAPGDRLLVHGGVAIGKLEEASSEV